MAITTVTLSSTGQTHYGTTPNNVANFSGTFAYSQISATSGQITITIQNTTDPSVRGSLVAMAWCTPTGSTVTGLAIAFNNTGLDLIATAAGTIDCQNSVTSYGNATMGLAIPSTETTTTPTVTWNCPGVNPRGMRNGIRNWQIGTIVINVTGTVLGSVTASSFNVAGSGGTSGTNHVWFATHYKWLNDTDIQTNTTVGDDFVSSS